MEKIVIFGGTFDPVHNGHLRIARAASLLMNADVVFVPNRAPRWKTPSTSPKDRLAMLQEALKEDGSPSFSIDLFEMNSKDDVNFTIDTVLYFKKKYPRRTLYLLLGADEVNSFPRWKEAKKIASLCTPLYVTRPGFQLDDQAIVDFHMARLPYDGSGDVSSEDIRNLRSQDIPSSVRDYIEKHNLYYLETLAKYETAHRLAHSLSVGRLAFGIAMTNRLEKPEDAYVAGILHDLGKHVSKRESEEIMRLEYPEYQNLPDWAFHQFVGVYLAKRVFGIQSQRILDAIEYHATGKAHMSPLGKIIYASDKIDPLRGYDSSDLIQACYGNYYVGFLETLEANREFLKEKGHSLDNALTQECMNLYLRKESVTETKKWKSKH